MGEIARSAAVSKGTLYVYFADKSHLFEAIVEEEMLEQGKVTFNFDPSRDVTTTLTEFGQAYIGMICRPGGGSAIRTVMAIAERMPEVGRRYYEHVLAHTIGRLARYLDAHVKRQELVILADLPGNAVPAVHLPGGAGAFERTHRTGGRQRDADVSCKVREELRAFHLPFAPIRHREREPTGRANARPMTGSTIQPLS
jgi:AcrR family transcriptional regulator